MEAGAGESKLDTHPWVTAIFLEEQGYHSQWGVIRATLDIDF